MLFRKYFAIPLLALIVFAGFTGCEEDDSNPVTPAAKSNVMVIHASPDAPGVDIIVDGNIAKSDLTYPTNTPLGETKRLNAKSRRP